jgi:hypothetical protein
VLRADWAYYGAEVIAAARRHKVHFSVTARQDRAVTAAIAAISDDAWTPIRYPRAVYDEQLRQWISDAEVAEVPFTAFGSKPKHRQVTARLIVRRVRDANPDHVEVNPQGELFPTYPPVGLWPTRPGWCWPRSRSTCSVPPARSPPPSTPERSLQPSAPS